MEPGRFVAHLLLFGRISEAQSEIALAPTSAAAAALMVITRSSFQVAAACEERGQTRLSALSLPVVKSQIALKECCVCCDVN